MKKVLIGSLLISFALTSTVYANNQQTKQKSVVSDKQEISVKDAKQALNKKTHVFIDVREQSEYDNGHIKGIKLIPLSTVQTEALKLDKSKKYIAVCHSGKRSN
ncbi:MAG: rhodanese-like domain-containing protein [Bacteroidia bacterium]